MISVKSVVGLLSLGDLVLSFDQGFFDVFLKYYFYYRVFINWQVYVLCVLKNEKDVQFFG